LEVRKDGFEKFALPTHFHFFQPVFLYFSLAYGAIDKPAKISSEHQSQETG
jgi:hypothetical protein